MRHIVKKKRREKRHDCIWISNVLDFEIDVCVYSFTSSIHVCMHSYIISCDETLRGRFVLPPRLLSPRQSAVVCKQTQRGKLCMRTGFRQSYLFYVNTFSIRDQLCVFVTLCAHAPASPRRSYLLECVPMWCCWWSAAFAAASSAAVLERLQGRRRIWIQPAVQPEYRERAGQIQKCAVRKPPHTLESSSLTPRSAWNEYNKTIFNF